MIGRIIDFSAKITFLMTSVPLDRNPAPKSLQDVLPDCRKHEVPVSRRLVRISASLWSLLSE